MIELRGVAKSYAQRPALLPTSFIAEPGQVTVLIGPSGSGKSTLVRLMLGLIEPDAGEILVDGERLTPTNAHTIRRRIGYVIQDGGLFPHLTVRGNVELLARQCGWPATRRSERIQQLAELVRLPNDLIERYPSQLSGGQRQRVGIMRALMLDPPSLLLDEPMGALDPLVRADLQDDLKQIFRELGKTVVLVTHDLGEAAVLGDRVVLLRDGQIVQKGLLSEFERAPADPFVTRFIRAQRGWSAAVSDY